MNRKKLLILSITSIVIILLAMIGITYGYFVTSVLGNTNKSSVQVSSATLSLEYSEDTDSNIDLDNMEPGTKATKTFSIENTGTATVPNYSVYLEDVINTFNRLEDLEILLLCKEYDADGNFVKDCNGTAGYYPTENQRLTVNSISPGHKHEYEFRFEYVYLDTTDQSEDVGKTISGLIQVYNETDVVDIGGTISGYNDGDYILVSNDNKTSQIKVNKTDATYKITALGLGQHTIKVMSSEGVERASETIKIVKSFGEEPSVSVDGTEIIIEWNSELAHINMEVSNTTLTLTGIEISTNAYNILITKILSQNPVYPDNELTTFATNVDNSGNPIGIEYTQTSGDTNGKGLYFTKKITVDGKRSYYFRGDVKNNFVQFGKNSSGIDMFWRIVRINEDGSIRLIYYGTNTENATPIVSSVKFNNLSDDNAYAGYMYGLVGVTEDAYLCLGYDADTDAAIILEEYTNQQNCVSNGGTWVTTAEDATHANIVSSTAKKYLDTWYEDNLKEYYSEFLADAGFCNDRVSRNTDERLFGQSEGYYINYSSTYIKLTCVKEGRDLFTTSSSSKGNKALVYPIGLITKSEMTLAGAMQGNPENSNVYVNDGIYSWEMSPYRYNTGSLRIFVSQNGMQTNKPPTGAGYTVKPVINLKENVVVTDSTQDGTASNPYVIKTN